MSTKWSIDQILELASSYQQACVLAAAADWDVFGLLSRGPARAETVAEQLNADCRAMAVLLDALSAMKLIEKKGENFSVYEDVVELLTEHGRNTVLPMVRHQANCMRRWAQLSQVLQAGKPAERQPSIRGEQADQAAFIEAMHIVSGPVADQIVAEIGSLKFKHLLDIGGASGTWTMAFLRTVPQSTATIFDLPEVIPMAEKRLVDSGYASRINLIGGDIYEDALPRGADFVWLSAIAHQNSRLQNRQLFDKIYAALCKGGELYIRDVVMNNSRTQPARGSLFAINMLVATEGGGTYTFNEYREDLEASGYTDINLVRQDDFMNSIIRAKKIE